MWRAVTDFLLKAHASGLGHDAVIEIMIAILAVMIAILALILGAVGLFFAGLSIYGYQAIKTESKRIAAKIAKESAAETFKNEFQRLAVLESTDALSGTDDVNQTPQPVISKGRKTSDSNLSKGKTT